MEEAVIVGCKVGVTLMEVGANELKMEEAYFENLKVVVAEMQSIWEDSYLN